MTVKQLSFAFEALNEEWRDIPGYEGEYQVSSLGRVRGLDRVAADGRRVRGTIKAQRLNGDGYFRVSFATGKRSTKLTHHVAHLVMLAFVGPKPAGMLVRHLDGNRTNNRRTNLRYGTRLENAADTRAHGSLKGQSVRRAYKRGPILKAEIIAKIRAAKSGREAARLYGVSATHAKEIRANRIPCWREEDKP